jgi:pSer/pThr/pTyr-binding forkhead associated (FHA) protein
MIGSGQATNVFLHHNRSAVMLPRGEINVGRSSGCFLRIDDPGVSRLHFRITVADEAIIEDLGSRNGTVVNGERITAPRELRDGDRIVIGNRMFRVSFIGANEVSFDDGEVTPFPTDQTPRTLPGVGTVELQESCPACGEPVPVGASDCPSCGFRRPRARPQATTEPETPTVYSRRRHRRQPARLVARYTSAGSGRDVEGELVNLSLSGAFVATGTPDSVGTRCTLELTEDGVTITLHGFVRHVIYQTTPQQPAGMGIEFHRLAPEAEQWLAWHLRPKSD